MKRFVAVLAVSGLALVGMSGTAQAGAPQGQGLVTPAEFGFPTIECDGQTADILTTRGDGASFWNLDDGTHLVVLSFTFTDLDTGESFTDTIGTKAGLTGNQVVCTGTGTFEEDGQVINGEIIVVGAVVPRRT